MREGSNAVARRLDRLHDQWNAFASNEAARLLRWLIRDDELRVVEAFVQTEQDDAAGEIPDLFLTFHEPFADVVSYGAALRASLIEQYEEARPDLREASIGDGWSPPPPEGRHSLTAFVEACVSLHGAYGNLVEKLALVLTPARIRDHGEWGRWLDALVKRLPAEVRVAVLDSVDEPLLAPLAEANPDRVVTIAADLDMPAAVRELARAGGVSTPDGQFRVQFTALSQAIGAGDMDAARSRGEAALRLATDNGWGHLAAAVHLALAGGFLGAARWREATAAYEAADAAAGRLPAEDPAVGRLPAEDPAVGRALRLQAALGRAAVLFAANEYAAGAQAYERAAALASETGDPVMLVESWRMAAYCYEQAGNPARAWDRGWRALEAAEGLPPGNRAHSTLPFAGEALCRVAADRPADLALVDRRLAELTGTPDWRALAAEAVRTA